MATIEEIPLSSAIAAEELRDALENEQGLQSDSHVGENDGEPVPIPIPTYASVESPWKARIVEASTIPLHTGKIVVYTIQTIADDSVTCTVSRRYSRFEELAEAVREFFRAKHRQYLTNLPDLGPKAWAWENQKSREFIANRVERLQLYLDRLLGLPHATECQALREFLFGADS